MKVSKESTNEQLLYLLQIGNAEAFQEFYRRKRTKVIGFAYKFVRSQEEAKELTQEIFVKFWENRAKIDPTKNPDSLLYVMVKYHTLDAWKRKLRHNLFLGQQHKEEPSIDSTTEYMDLQECKKVLALSLNSLPQQAKKVYQLSREDGYSHQEIADHLNISIHTVSNHIKKSIQHIRQYHIHFSSGFYVFAFLQLFFQ